MKRRILFLSFIMSFFASAMVAIGPVRQVFAGAVSYFTTQIDSGEINNTQFIHLADMDGDRDLDILNTTNDGNLVLIPNNGNKTYGDVIPITSGYGWMRDVTTIDYDNDGDLDIVFMYMLNGTTVLVPNLGDLTFGTPIKLHPMQYGVYTLQTMDVDNDDLIDIVGTSSTSDIVFWFRNKGDGSFASQTTLVSFDGARYLKVADLNGDSYLDLIVNSHDVNRLVWFPNNGNGTFGTLNLIGAANMPEHFSIGDVDGDDDIDIVGAFNTQSSVYLYKNDGTGTFTSTLLASNGATVLVSPTSAAFIDINSDGHLDVLFNSYSFGMIYSMFNDGTGTFSGLTTVVNGTLNTPFEIEVADMDDDGDDDFVVASYGSKKVSIFENNMVSNYVVRFVSNGGSLVPTLSGSSGTPVVLPDDPTKEGYNFTGWFTDKALTIPYTDTTMSAEYKYVYAGWELSSQPLKYLDFDNTELFNESFEPGASLADVDAPTPTRVGYTFNGWDITLPSTMPEEPLTLKAQYVINNYTLTFESNGGSEVNAVTDAYNEPLSLPTPTKTGYTFSGWFLDSGLTQMTTLTTIPAENVTMYAKWTINQYTVTFESNGGSEVDAVTDAYNEPLSLPTPTKTGYTFNGWFMDSGLTQMTTLTTIPAENVTMYAKWTINQYTVTFIENGGTVVENVTSNYNSVFSLPTPTRTGYTFSGWHRDVNLTMITNMTLIPATDFTLYAKWTINQYTVTFEENDGTEVDDVTANYDAPFSLPAITRSGHTFGGWYLDSDFTQLALLTNIPAENITLYAKWSYVPYTVTYTIDGALVTEVLYFGESPANIPGPSMEGYAFIGWKLGNQLVNPSDFVQDVTPVTFVAQFKDVTKPVISGLLNPTVNLSQVSTFEIPMVSIDDNSGAILTPQLSFYKADGVTEIANLAAIRVELGLGHQVIIRYDVTDKDGNRAAPMIVVVNVHDDIKPIVTGIESGVTYDEGTSLTIHFNEGSARLNGKIISTGTTVSQSGNYTLIVTDLSGNKTIQSFAIASPSISIDMTGVTVGDVTVQFDLYLFGILVGLLIILFFIWKPTRKK